MKKLMLMGLMIVASWADSHAMSTVDIVAKVKPAVVLITVLDGNHQPFASGTGFFIQGNYVVTNSHVIQGAAYLRIEDLSGTSYYTLNKIVADSPERDLAILRTKGNGRASLSFGDSKHLLEGQNILIIGNPEGLIGDRCRWVSAHRW
jgi:putative serine protease PepD